MLGLHEEHCGEILLKFPGGGLEFGESLTDCLHREFKEELSIEIEILDHFTLKTVLLLLILMIINNF